MARMKRNSIIALRAAVFLALLSSMAHPGSAADKKAQAPEPEVRIEVLMVAMPEEKYITLRPDLLDAEKIEKAVPTLLDAVKRKEMILEGLPVILTKGGQRAVSETTREFEDHSISAGLPTTPTAFEMRSLGVTLEVEPVILQDGKTIELNLVPQRVDVLAPPAGGDEEKKAAAGKEEQPPDLLKIYWMKVTTSVRLTSGQHLLIASHKMRQPEGYVEIFILHAEVIAPGE